MSSARFDCSSFSLSAVTQFYADHATQVAFFRNVAESDEKDQRYLIEEVAEFEGGWGSLGMRISASTSVIVGGSLGMV
ncbi:hypothetical protein QTH90_11850 [Variovorax sp. J2P1-59]|uniref:hypothetical protein n=1 Tax=Variovorax flavidus TaxID=3053501 RepID=UPI0025763A3E|nr:hypothetical protein [Variovorax sp. J2P1-59]MDM0075080.1 hypothetical protein [Variovorax sp. J2P1-59]